MANNKKTAKVTAKTSPEKGASKASPEKDAAVFPILKDSYRYILIGVGILVVGFLLMAGGKSDDPNVFNPDIFSFRRITLAPIVVVAGFGFIMWAIMRKPKENASI